MLTGSVIPCTAFIASFLSAQLNFQVQLDKNEGMATGSATLSLDLTSPFDCVAGSETTGSVTLTPLAQSHDQDLDGCSDWEELGASELSGGLRDPFNFWDFYDVPTGTWPDLTRNKAVASSDIFAVIARFGTTGDPNVDPLSLPPATG